MDKAYLISYVVAVKMHEKAELNTGTNGSKKRLEILRIITIKNNNSDTKEQAAGLSTRRVNISPCSAGL